ncbi:MAG TPA: dTMP kinase [Streptosporangiaceae bacterium]|nr:dTMP kinase [Streptosporangiaceae bacterium]
MRSSDGLFISVDGPSGVGKSDTVRALSQVFADEGRRLHVTCEPSDGLIGKLARELTDTVHGNALACLYAADRYHHLDAEIVPHLKAGEIVITDRYIPSALVMQQLDGVDPDYLWRINAKARRPDLAVILDADPLVLAERLRSKGPHNRLQRLPSSSQIEWHHYRQISQRLTDAGWIVHRVDSTAIPTTDIAHSIYERLQELAITAKRESSSQQ